MIYGILKDIKEGEFRGYLTHEETSAIQNKPWIRPEDVLKIAGKKLDPAPAATTTRSDNFYKNI